MSRLYLIDASCFIFRAYYSVSDQVRDARGEPANALLGFGLFLCELLERRNPGHIAVAFDESLRSSFRNTLYPDYKAHRPEAPSDLASQFRRCRDFAAALGLAHFGSVTHEADDLIGTLATRMRDKGFSAVYVSADKDLAQLMGEDDRLWDPSRRRWLDGAGVYAQMGVHPRQVADFLGLAGDAVDNIPGVPGIGTKTAARLLAHCDNLEALYSELGVVTRMGLRGAMRVRRLLEEHEEQAWLSRELATIDCEAPLSFAPTELAWRGACAEALEALELPPILLRRAMRLVPVYDLEA
mgnify:CR=1 FL=1